MDSLHVVSLTRVWSVIRTANLAEWQVEIRLATKSDAEQVRKIAYSAMHTFGLVPDPEGIDIEVGRFGESFEGALLQLVACCGDEILGRISLSQKDSKTAKISGFYVDPSHRGKGIGEKLLVSTIRHAQKIPLSGIYLETWDKMEAAVRLYVKFGWYRVSDPPEESGAQRAYYLSLNTDNKPLHLA